MAAISNPIVQAYAEKAKQYAQTHLALYRAAREFQEAFYGDGASVQLGQVSEGDDTIGGSLATKDQLISVVNQAAAIVSATTDNGSGVLNVLLGFVASIDATAP